MKQFQILAVFTLIQHTAFSTIMKQIQEMSRCNCFVFLGGVCSGWVGFYTEERLDGHVQNLESKRWKAAFGILLFISAEQRRIFKKKQRLQTFGQKNNSFLMEVFWGSL